ncbi:aldehyde dehydrogenase family protein [Conexibacter sp. DBS9H8]|uniref:aldehyde dehydrogenase family protein n=1 Tax=Conexibacter sp. DBS9H8 TaxID=2937801 RepID=UPI00200CD40E|nr:aldehyde dehydrogenase family protein [Conexibacter sp. DBS9H8]
MASPATLTVSNPHTGEPVGEVPVHSPEALAAALTRGAGYVNALTRHERSEILFTVARRIAERADELAALITAESGVCLSDSRHETGRAVDVFRFAAMEALRDDGETFSGDISAHGQRRRAHTLRVPVRLVGAITPFNHPLNQVAHKLAPAIAVGAPIVLKPSEKTPLTALALSEIITAAGLAPAACQVLCAEPASVLDAFLADPSVELISFTGGVAVGKLIASRLGYRRAVLELGGNDPLIVLADADLEQAAALAVTGAFANSGQRCTAVKRIIAVEAVADELADRVRAGAAAIRVGDPADPATGIGTVIDEPAAVAIEARIAEAIADGAALLYGGERRGAQLTPAVLDHVSVTTRLVATETFGPVAPIIRVADLDAAIATANATPYALSAGVVSSHWPSIQRCVTELRAGTVNVGEVPGWRTELTPFGGIGDSGLGVKEGVREAMRAMSFTKLYTLPWG